MSLPYEFVEYAKPFNGYNSFDSHSFWENVRIKDYAIHDQWKTQLQQGIKVGAYQEKESS